uniref:Uncharacterized protein n=1 Tax=Phlebotomus papatasi TaxID=29031 RepID=A0A1B0DK72_PHLPP
MEYECHCGKNYLFVDPLCQGSVIEKLEEIIGGIVQEEHDKTDESLAIISTVISSVSSIANYLPDLGENYVTSLTMEVPIDAESIPYFMDHPILREAQNSPSSIEDDTCKKCQIIDHRVSIILSFGFFLLGLKRYTETDLIRKIIYLLCPFRRKHPEIVNFFDQLWKLSLKNKLCSSLVDHIVIFHCHPIDETIENLLKGLESNEILLNLLIYNQEYLDLAKSARKSTKVFNRVAENIVKKFLLTRKILLRDFLTYFVEDLRNTVLPTFYLRLFSDVLYPFAAFAVADFLDKPLLDHYLEELRTQNYK